MKTETQIAKANVSKDTKSFLGFVCQEHKASCQRFLLKYDTKEIRKIVNTIQEVGNTTFKIFAIKLIDDILDNRRAIKLYEDNGI